MLQTDMMKYGKCTNKMRLQNYVMVILCWKATAFVNDICVHILIPQTCL